MNMTHSTEVLSLLSSWSERPDAVSDLKEIFGATPETSASLLNRIRNNDFSWLPRIEILSAEILSPAIAAYARENETIYLSDACSLDLQTEALLEEIGHHIDALLNTEETPGDEGALFSATVRGVELSEEEIATILNEDDSAVITHQGSLLLVECIIPRGPTLPPAPPTPPANDTISTAVSTTLPATSHGLLGTGLASISLTGNSPGIPLAYNYLQANGGNDTLIAGNATTTSMVGGLGNNWFLGGTGNQTDFFKGGSGNNTMVAANGAATLIGGSGNNSLLAGNGKQSLIGGGGNNILIGGIDKDTLRAGTGMNTLRSGSAVNGGNTLIGGGTSSSLMAGFGNDSLFAASGSNTLFGGTGNDTISVTGGVNWLQSGSSSAGGNTLIGGSGANTLIAGLGKDSLLGGSGTNYMNASLNAAALIIVGGTGSNTLIAGSLAGGESLVGGKGSNTFLVTSQSQANKIGLDTLSFSSLSSASLNSLDITAGGISVSDSLFTHIQAGYIPAVIDLNSSAGNLISLGSSAQTAGVRSLVSGAASDTLNVAGFTSSAVLNGSAAISRVNLVGSTKAGALGDTFLGSHNGYDVMKGSTGSDLFILQNTTGTSSISGNGGTDTLEINRNASLNYQTFNALTGISVLSLAGGTAAASGVNTVGSLQGSGITKIIGGVGVDSDVISASVAALVKASTNSNASSITLILQNGASGTMGFTQGQHISGNGIAPGTTITGVTTGTGTITLSLSQPTSALIAQGTLITGYLNNVTIDGHLSTGQNATSTQGALALQEVINLSNYSNGIYLQNKGVPDELPLDVQALQAQQSNPLTYIQTQGDSLVVGGSGELVKGAISTAPDSLLSSSIVFTDSYGNKVTNISFKSHVVTDNTFVSGMFNNSGTASLIGAQNTLVGGPGTNTYILNNLPGDTLLPTIQNLQYHTVVGGIAETIQSGSTIQFKANAIHLTDNSFANVGAGTAQIIKTANGNNLINLGQYGAQVGIQTIIGGIGADTFATIPTLDGNGNLIPYQQSVYFDGSHGTGNQSLVSGVGNDTLFGGNGNATLQGGDGNNSLIGGSGSNLIQSGVGNSTLDGGLGASTMQAAGGTNLFIVRNRADVILNASSTIIRNPYSLEAGSAQEVSNVDSYVNFDPIQSTQVNQFAPTQPDGSPSITKSQSFASADLSAFFSIANFTLDAGAVYGGALYGVGNALDNNIVTTGSLSHLVLGMGGNNTIVGSGTGDSLYGYVNSTYANPDLYAAAPYDTRDQSFINGVIGTSGNNSIVANGANSYLDGGPGYNDGLSESSGSNTLIGNAANDTFVIHNQADSIVAAAGGNNYLTTTVNLHSIADNINNLTLLVTSQAPDLPNINPNNPILPANSGQTDPATFLGYGNGLANSNETLTTSFGNANLPIVQNHAAVIGVQYGASYGQQYESDQTGQTPSAADPLPLEVSPLTPDPNNLGSLATTLTWEAPSTGGPVVGYTVNYRTDDGNGNLGAWKTYVNGNSNDLAGTSTNPSLTVDNLPSGYTYDFQVTAQQLTLPTTTDPSTGVVIASPVTLQSGNGNAVLFGFAPAIQTTLASGQIYQVSYNYNDTNAILSNNPLPSGTIPTPSPYSPTQTIVNLYPVYLQAGQGDDLMDTRLLGNGDGSNYSVGGVTFSGLNTMVGGIGSDSFVVSNGNESFDATTGVFTSGNFDQCIKYGEETPVNYTNIAPGVTLGDTLGVTLNGGQHNMVLSRLSAIQLSSTVVSQGEFVDELALIGALNENGYIYGGQFGEGNALNNFIYDPSGVGGNTLVGNTGRDCLDGMQSDVLIGGTATGLDNVGLAIVDFKPLSLQGNGLTTSIYRDTDPVPSTLSGGPGTADPSQYWTHQGANGWVYNNLSNSDTLIATGGGSTLDGGAGNDSMVGSTSNDIFYVSSSYYNTLIGLGGDADNGSLLSHDVLVGNGGNDTVIFTGSDVYWSGLQGATTSTLGYTLSNTGDSGGSQSISNIILQMGDPIAMMAYGNSTSTGNATLGATSQFSGNEIGSNVLVGNEYGATLNGGGVGGTDPLGNYGDGTGIGLDSLVGNSGKPTSADTFVINTSTTVRVPNYTGSSNDVIAAVTTSVPSLPGGGSDTLHTAITSITAYATDEDYAVINVKKSSVDSLPSGGATIELASNVTYLIGSIPSTSHTTSLPSAYGGDLSFGSNNINGGYLNTSNTASGGTPVSIGLSGVKSTDAGSTEFGIYALTSDKAGKPVPNLVAVVLGIKLDSNSTGSDLNFYSSSGLTADGQNLPGHMGEQYSSSVLYDNGALPTAENFAGMGAFYELAGTNFATQHVQFV